MEPVSILLATGAVAIYAAHRVEKMSEKARRGPVTLPELMDAQQVDDAAPVQILAVHVQHGLFQRKLQRESLKVRVKYGAPGASIHCDTAKASMGMAPSPTARFVPRLDHQNDLNASFGTTCLFLGQRNTSNRIRLRLIQTGLLGRTLAKAEVHVPDLGQCSPWMEFHPELQGTKESEVLGTLSVALETKVMMKGELRQFLRLLGAKQRQQGFLLDILPVVEGCVDEPEDDASVQGEKIAKASRTSLRLCGG
ncbi:unnamed protein product [Durusdinium trenchii]|uniref:Uncharacterized protein n=3 Tax=Durusdinium trenchii TaxID=1381693 RepID=A0ABP0LTM4_9DINO